MQIKKGTEIRKQLIESFYFKNRMAIAVEIVVAIVTGLLAVTVSWVSQQLMDAGDGTGSRNAVAAGRDRRRADQFFYQYSDDGLSCKAKICPTGDAAV